MNLANPHYLIGTWFGLGLMKKAPGSWGSLGGMVFGMILLVLGGAPALVQAMLLLLVAGWWASDQILKETNVQDNQIIVIDEVVGIMIAMIAAGGRIEYIMISFILFRVFDIIKPWPVSWCQEKLPGAYGVMADDVAAGIYALLFLYGMRIAGLG